MSKFQLVLTGVFVLATLAGCKAAPVNPQIASAFVSPEAVSPARRDVEEEKQVERERLRIEQERVAHQQAKLLESLESQFEAACVNFDYLECSKLLEQSPDDVFSSKVEARLQEQTASLDVKYDEACGPDGTPNKCADFGDKYPGFKSPVEIFDAYQALVDSFDNSQAVSAQKCVLREEHWLYQGEECKDGFAHGFGRAVRPEKALAFEGRFEDGRRVQGKLLFNETPMYDGPITDSRPHGDGVCFHQGEPEECKYYEGKRIDMLYKQRVEFNKQSRELLNQQKIMESRLLELERSQRQLEQTQRDQIRRLQAARQQDQYQRRSFSEGVSNALVQEAQKRIAERIFDSLF